MKRTQDHIHEQTRHQAVQLGLFGEDAAPPEREAARAPRGPVVIEPAPLAPGVAEVARRLPRSVHLGTSSWSFPGWAGVVYDKITHESALAREGLRAYARHPLLRSVGVDKAFYRPPTREEFERLAGQVPSDFRFLVKAHSLVTQAETWAKRDGFLESRPNAWFLDSEYALREVVSPCVEGLGERLGVLLVQLSPMHVAYRDHGPGSLTPARVVDRLERFLRRMPPTINVAVEVRNRELLTPAYAAALRSAGASHAYSVHARVPPLKVQTKLLDPAKQPVMVCRWMLHAGQTYESARRRYAPFNRIIDDDPLNRAAIADLVAGATARGATSIVIANNKAEGSAPRTLEALAETIAGRTTLG
jgi:uncharacterized protein YecE (DUF72 family)